jgi:hypothetical protein
MREHRKELRRDYLSRVTLTYTDEAGVTSEAEGMVEDRSQSGFGIRVKGPIRIGTSVGIRQSGKSHVGVVRRCTASTPDVFGKYIVGIEIDRHQELVAQPVAESGSDSEPKAAEDDGSAVPQGE